MGMPKGRSGNPAGRPKGARNKKSLVAEETIRKMIHAKATPLDFLLGVMNSQSKAVGLNLKIDAAKAAAPYVHKKMPTDVSLGGGVGVQHGGGVMIVPAVPGSVQDWAKAAAAAQAQLKEDVKK